MRLQTRHEAPVRRVSETGDDLVSRPIEDHDTGVAERDRALARRRRLDLERAREHPVERTGSVVGRHGDDDDSEVGALGDDARADVRRARRADRLEVHAAGRVDRLGLGGKRRDARLPLRIDPAHAAVEHLVAGGRHTSEVGGDARLVPVDDRLRRRDRRQRRDIAAEVRVQRRRADRRLRPQLVQRRVAVVVVLPHGQHRGHTHEGQDDHEQDQRDRTPSARGRHACPALGHVSPPSARVPGRRARARSRPRVPRSRAPTGSRCRRRAARSASAPRPRTPAARVSRPWRPPRAR